VGASYFLKKGAIENHLINMSLIIGISIMGFAFIFYYLSLNKLSLSIVYPIITSISIILITTMGALFFQETITIKHIIAIILIITGILVLFI
jgi:multidrug transporter EmrE-like cation transporter